MFIPIGDENPRETTPYVNYTLLALNIAAFLVTALPGGQELKNQLMMVPRDVRLGDPSTWLTLFTSMFLHAGLLHIAGNMLFLWIFGDNVEDKLGHVAYVLFYLLCGLAADVLHIYAATHILTEPIRTAAGLKHYAEIPTLGASGAISGVLGAYLVFFPTRKVKVLFFFFLIAVWRWPAWVWIGIWFLEQLIFSTSTSSGVAYFAHIGGFVGGVALAAAAKYVFVPRRFQHADTFHPVEIGAASRWGDRSRLRDAPLVTVEDDGVFQGPVQAVSSRYALLRLSDELPSIGRIAAVAAAASGEGVEEIRRRLAASRGMILRSVPQVAAERAQIELRKIGIPTLVVPYGPEWTVRPRDTDRVSWDDRRLSFTVGAETQPVPWTTPFLYVGAVAAREPQIDVFVTPRHAYRVTPRTVLVQIDWAARREARVTLRDFAAAIAESRQGAALNDGIRVMATRGSWGWLAFADPDDYENYAFWLTSLLLSRRPLSRVR
ncbi:MAG: rhomboid family intramembrane serine protease [Planctomycetes bacterium]|nr:rhomboid family intramembrane serine protease [Planctomycetota bacterium]